MGLKNEWLKFINKMMWILVWDSPKRKNLRKNLPLIEGKNNKIIFFSEDDSARKAKKSCAGLCIRIKGSNNTVKIARNTDFYNSHITIHANNATVIIGENSVCKDLDINICCGNGQKIILGKNIRAFGVNIYLNEKNAALIVKDDCLFSNSISIWPTDGHAIFDKDTKQRINNIQRPLEIGEHCWIGEGVKLTKNAKLPPNTIVGIGAVVTKEFNEEYTIIAGNPAKVIKKNVIWHPNLEHKF